jgi:hypothetical protein
MHLPFQSHSFAIQLRQGFELCLEWASAMSGLVLAEAGRHQALGGWLSSIINHQSSIINHQSSIGCLVLLPRKGTDQMMNPASVKQELANSLGPLIDRGLVQSSKWCVFMLVAR